MIRGGRPLKEDSFEAAADPHAALRSQLQRGQFLTSTFTGHTDPAKRKATVEFAWYGADAADNAHAMYDALVASFKAINP